MMNAWIHKNLSSILSISTIKNKSHNFSREDVISVSREAGTINQIQYHGRSFAGKDISGYKIIEPGQLIYTKSPLKGAPYGIFQISTVKGIISPLYAVYNSTDSALAKFIGLKFKSDIYSTNYLAPFISKGSKNTINITDEGALQGFFQIPSIVEQKKISGFINKIDNLCTLTQRKLEKLQLLKKAYLELMFV